MKKPIVAPVAFVLLFFATSETGRSADWEQLPALHDENGFAGSFAGVSHDVLLIAGGANFPDKKPWEGGQKVWHDSIFALETSNQTGNEKKVPHWEKVGTLPSPLGYGVSASDQNGLVCVGGSDAKQHHADAFRLESKGGKIERHNLPKLPTTIANAGGTVVGSTLYVVGGIERPDAAIALKKLFSLDLASREPTWKELDALPGPGRIFPIVAAYDNALFVFGGAELLSDGEGRILRRYLKDGFRFQPGQGWKPIADLPTTLAAAPSPCPSDPSGIYVLGGDDGSKVGFKPPEKHPGFSKQLLRYDPAHDQWKELGEMPVSRANATVTKWQTGWIIGSGEIFPGVRSPEIWQFSPPGQ